MKVITSNLLMLILSIVCFSVNAQQLNFTNDYVHDSSIDEVITSRPTDGNADQKVLGILPVFIFNEFPINHNMHITADGDYYYTINGGSSGSGQINKFSASGVLIQSYPILIDGRGLSYNAVDGFLYASLYGRDVVKITDLTAGTFVTLFPAIMQNDQASFALSPDGTKFYDFFQGTLYVHDMNTGLTIDTITGLSYGGGNFGGEAAVAVDTANIYTFDATMKTVYTYDLSGNFIQTTVLDSGENGHSLSIANGYLFVSHDGNYAIGTWYGYQLSGSTGMNPALNDAAAIEIYPNPTQGKLYINGAVDELEIYNAIGELVFSKTNLIPDDEIDLSEHSKGIYFVRIRMGEENLSKKIILQ